MIFIYILNILIIIVTLIFYYKKNNKKDRTIIIKTLIIINLIIAFMPYNLILTFSNVTSAFRFFHHNKKIIDILEDKNDSVVLYNNQDYFDFEKYYRKGYKWKSNIFKEEEKIVKKVDDIEYNITIIKLNEQNNVIVISNNNQDNLTDICNNNNLKKHKIKSINICYGVINKENILRINEEYISL